MRPEDVVIGREYTIRAYGYAEGALIAHSRGTVTVLSGPASDRVGCPNGHKRDWWFDVSVPGYPLRAKACACALHPITDPDASTERETAKELES